MRELLWQVTEMFLSDFKDLKPKQIKQCKKQRGKSIEQQL